MHRIEDFEKVIDFVVPRRDSYKADACILRCFDDRFHLPYEAFVKRRKFVFVDPVVRPGIVKKLATPGVSRKSIAHDVRTSISLHKTEVVILIAHMACGAYGGSSAFRSEEQEFSHYVDELSRAADYLVQELGPSVSIETFIMTFRDGMRSIAELKAGKAPAVVANNAAAAVSGSTSAAVA